MEDAVANSCGVALDAADKALLRAGDARNSESRQSLIEATWWIATGDEYLREAYGHRWTASEVRNENADLLDGIFWARSRAFHDPLSLTTLDRQGAFSNAFSSAFDTALRWRQWQDVEKISVALGRPNRHIKNRRPAYGRRLAGEPVLDTLRAALKVLESVDLEAFGPVG